MIRESKESKHSTLDENNDLSLIDSRATPVAETGDTPNELDSKQNSSTKTKQNQSHAAVSKSKDARNKQKIIYNNLREPVVVKADNER